jgi:hypothetical protein
MCEFCNHDHHHNGGEMTEQMHGHDHMHGHCLWNKHRVLRIVLLLGMLFFVFWVGVKVGEFRGEFGYGRMMGDYGYGDYGYRSGMMRNAGYYGQGRGMMGGYYLQVNPGVQQGLPVQNVGY